jgi:hypothetical protein
VARRLAQPPAYRLAVLPPAQALLPEAGAQSFADSLAEALEAAEVPAVSGEPLPLDWRLAVSAETERAGVVLRYALQDADGTALGMMTGAPVPTQEWSQGRPETFRRVAGQAAPGLADLLARVDAERRTGDERAASPGGGPPPVRLLAVQGAPGDGNQSLTQRMREQLGNRGFRVQEEAQGAAFAVQGRVNMAPAGRGLQRVEILWTVSRRDGEELGRVLQMNEVPTGSLNGLWADVALVVAEEAAGGVRDVISNAGGLSTGTEEAAAASR